MKRGRMVLLGSYVVPAALVLSGVGWSTRQALQETQERTAAAAVRETRDPTPGPGPTDDVAIVGDSITEQSELPLRNALGSAFRPSIRARGGYRAEDMEPYAIELATNHPEQVIVELGTNDVLTDWPLDKTIESLDRTIKRFPDAKCIHVVTVGEVITTENNPGVQSRAIAFNAELRRIAAEDHASVIDWAGAINQDIAGGSVRGGLLSDTVHPNSQGKHALGELFTDALRSCTPKA